LSDGELGREVVRVSSWCSVDELIDPCGPRALTVSVCVVFCVSTCHSIVIIDNKVVVIINNKVKLLLHLEKVSLLAKRF